jgi:dephospho-CoA kinase
MASPVRVFGLTGGLASGKSTVAARLRARRLPVIDADALARAVTSPASPALAKIVQTFGSEALRDGVLDRRWLASVVFADESRRLELEAILHPEIQARRDVLLAELAARGEPLACYEVPLLFEKGLERGLRPVVLVRVPEAVQIQRAQARDGEGEAQVRARLAAQLPLADKAARADYVIDNDGSIEDLHAATDRVLKQICTAMGVDLARYFDD